MDDGDERVREQVARWRDELLDLTGRNRLLRFRHTKAASLEIDRPGAQEVLDRLLTGRAREWPVHIPADPVEEALLDPTAAPLGLGPADRSGSTAAAVLEALERLGTTASEDGALWVSFGALRWQHDGAHCAALFLVPAVVEPQGRGWRLRLREPELVVNPALLAHFERAFDFDLGEERYRVESAGIQAYVDDLRTAFEPIGGKIDDRIGLISARQHAAMLEGELDVTPGVLLVDAPREGVLAGLTGALEEGLPIVPARARALGVPLPRPAAARGGPLLHTTKATARDVRAACSALARRTSQEFMDKGLWILYLGVGMLHWSDPADGRAEAQDSPLLLVPVRLEATRRGAEWKLLPSDEEPLVNPALWRKLETELGIVLPELDPEEPIEVGPLLDAVRAALHERPEWAVEERLVLSTFSFHKEAMYRDLRDNFAQVVAHPVIAALARDPGAQEQAAGELSFEPVDERELDAAFPPEQATTILDADASQRQCIAAARDGRSFVMDGPPGTGKSQTIANMIAELISDGRTVLFVSEKAAALDVVHNRLASSGLDEYVLELHSHKTTRATVAGALGASLLRRPKPNPQLTESDLDAARRRREELSAYAEALNEPLDALGGVTLHRLLGRIAALQHLPQAPVAARALATAHELETIRELGERLRATWEVVERGEDFAWRGASAGTWGAATEQRVLATLDGLADELDGLRARADAIADDLLLDPPAGPRAARALAALLDHLRARPEGVVAAWIATRDEPRVAEVAERTAARAVAAQSARVAGERAAGPRWAELADDRAVGVQRSLAGLGIALPAGARADDVRRLAASAQRLAQDIAALRLPASDLAALLGLRSAELTLAQTESLVALAELAQAPAPPPSPWLLAGDVLERAGEAARELTALLDAERAARANAAIFEPSVLALDLPALAARFAHEHRGLKRLGGAFRADRDALAATATGVKPKAAVAAIDGAVAWQAARAALDAAASTRAAVLGTAWSGAGTEPAELARRLEIGAQAVQLAGDRIADRSRFAAVLSGERPAGGAIALATQVDAAVAGVRAATPDALAELLDGALDTAAARLAEAAATLGALAELAADVDLRRGTPGPAQDALVAAGAATEAAAAQRAQAADAEASALLEHWARLDVDPAALRGAVTWAAALRALLPAPPTQGASRRLATATPDPAELHAGLARCRSALERLLAEFDAEHRGAVGAEFGARFDDAAALLGRLRATRGDIETWTAHAGARDALRAAGLGDAVAFCDERRVAVGQLVDVLRRSALEALADELLAERAAALGSLRAGDRDRIVREYASLDRKVVADAAHRVMRAANARRPNAILGVATIIANEAQKKKRHMPVSQLLARTAPVAQALKPCFMMSPLSVSQFLAPDMRFDVVIFDEASQVRPCDAVNALYRGRAMIVAGDQKQLPPMTFWDPTSDDGDEWSEDALADFDSVLDLAKGAGAFRSLSLRWHYRSRHEHLIAFSNHRFYGGELVTFPSPTEAADDLGVRLLPVEGVYRRGTSRDNVLEAHAVAERVFAHAERGARSIGVVAFSEAQASLIEEVLRQDERREDTRFAELFSGDRLDGLFVKNLENVQGDERDVVIFSVGYGPDEHGKLTLNFGPINREGGWRRLNVAITRARERVEVICSFDPQRLARGSSNRGVDELQRYLDFAANGPPVLAIDAGRGAGAGAGAGAGEPESPFEEAVLRTLRSWGHDVVAQVGTAGYRIDMAVRHPTQPGRFALGVECDGAMYHSAHVARDRDRLREQVLGGLGWTLHRIWGPSWYRDRSGEERRLREAIERALLAADAPRPGLPPPAAHTALAVDFEDLVLDAPPSWAEPYATTVLPLAGSADPGDARAIDELRVLVLQTVAEEAPIVEDLLARRVIGAWGVVLSERRRAAIGRTIEALVGAGTLVRRGNAVCLPNQRTDLVRVPVAGDERSEREVRQVPDVELAEAVARLVAEARVVTTEEAQQKAARLFGWRRNGPAIQAAMARAVDELAASGRLERADGVLRAPGPGRTENAP